MRHSHRSLFPVSLALLLAWTLAPAQTPIETITLRSGNGPIGSTDPLVTMLVAPISTYPPSTPTPSEFAAAAAGSNAPIVAPNSAWISNLPSDPQAKWIGLASAGARSALFAVTFDVQSQAISNATVDLRISIDNALVGVYFNEAPISAFSVIPPVCSLSGGCFGYTQAHQVVRSDIGPLLASGGNILYLHLFDDGSVAGVVFSLTISLYGSMIPEFQTNSPLAHLDINGIAGTNATPATTTIFAGLPATLTLGSTNMGFLWELGYGLAPLVPASGGGWVSAGGQAINLDLTDPAFGVLWNYFNSPYGFVNTTLPFSLSDPAAVSVQLLVVAPTLLDGVAISQPTRLIVQ